MQAVPLFCKISVSTLDTAARLKSPSFVLRTPSLVVRLCCSETKFVERTLEECLDVTVHLQSSPESLFLMTLWFASKYPLYLQASSSNNTQTGKRKDRNRQGRHAETHATEHAAEQQDSQQRVHNRTIQMVHSLSSSAATNLTHQLVASNL